MSGGEHVELWTLGAFPSAWLWAWLSSAPGRREERHSRTPYRIERVRVPPGTAVWSWRGTRDATER